MLFAYKARNDDGTLVTGNIEGANSAAVKVALASQGLLPVEVKSQGFEISLRSLFRRKVSPKDLLAVIRQFQVMFSAGTPMDRILRTLVRQTQNKELKEVLGQIHEDVSSGIRLSQAFAKHPKFFNSLYTSMLAVGEAGGVLDKTLKGLADILKKEHGIKTKVKSAILYPKIVLFAVTVVSILMLVYVIPVFADFYAQYEAQLPLPTLILIGISDAVTAYWYIALLIVAGLVFAWKRFIGTSKGKRFLGRMKLKIPVFGNLNFLVANARFGHLVGALYNAGLPISPSLDIVSKTIDNSLFVEDVVYLKQEVDRGKSIGVAMGEAKYFSPLMVESSFVGEQTGRLGELFEQTASFYDEEIDDILKNLAILIEPIMLFLLFGMITLLALAVYLPVWKLSKVILPGGGG